MLTIEALTEFNTRDLGQGISSIRTLQWPCQQVVLLNWLRAISWIDAGTSKEQQLLHLNSPSILQNVILNL